MPEKREKQQFEYHEDDPFDGVFFYLSKKYGGNVHEKGIVKVTASSVSYNSPQQVTDHGWGSNWYSDDKPNQWIQFDFLEKRKIELSGYSIKTYNSGPNQPHLRNWCIEGSNDGENWVELDKQLNDNNLNGASFHHYYPVSKKAQPFRFIRLMMIGINHRSDNYLLFTGFEMFGNLYLSE